MIKTMSIYPKMSVSRRTETGTFKSFQWRNIDGKTIGNNYEMTTCLISKK